MLIDKNEIENFLIENGPLVIPFGGHVVLSTGYYTDRNTGSVVSDYLRLNWSRNLNVPGYWLDKDCKDVPLVYMVFTGMDSVHAMMTQMVILEFNHLARKNPDASIEDILSNIEKNLLDAHASASDKIKEVLSEKNKFA